MKRLGPLLVCLLVAGSISPSANAAPKSREARAATLPREVVIKAAGPASTVVRVTTAMSLDTTNHAGRMEGPNPSIEIDGRGLFSGIAIVPEPYTPDAKIRPIIIGRFRQCSSEGCSTGGVTNIVGPGISGGDWRLEPGLYRIYLINDGSPAMVRLHFSSGPVGRVALQPREDAAVDLASPDISPISDVPGMWAAGHAYDAGKVGLSLTALWAELPSKAEHTSGGVCQIQVPTAPPDAAYGPACSAADQGLGAGTIFLDQTVGRRFSLLASFGYHDQGAGPTSIDGRFGLGTWLSTPQSQPSDIGTTTLFLQTADTWD